MIDNCTENDLKKLMGSKKRLTNLSFVSFAVSTKLLKCVSENLVDLKTLSLQDYTGISLQSIQSICKLENLKELDISYCNGISDDALIVNLRKLQVLKIEQIEEITDVELGGKSNLKEFYCRGCTKLEDSSLINLLKCAANLEIINIEECTKITKSVIDVAIQVTKVRTNNVVLDLYVNGTSIHIDKIKENSPLLHLHYR